jgi:fluoride exporter
VIKYVTILAGGGLGALVRYVAGVAIMERYGGRFPLGTFVINVTGCFAIGVLMPLLTERVGVNPLWRLLLVTGFLGGYTTFSSFGWETVQAVRGGDRLLGLMNAAGSLILGYIAVWLGVLVADFIRR